MKSKLVLVSLALLAAAASATAQFAPFGPEMAMNSVTTDDQRVPAAAILPNDAFVLVWNSGPAGGNPEIFARRFNPEGLPTFGSEFQVNQYTTTAQYSPKVAADSSGNFVVIWSDYGRDGSLGGVFGRRFDVNGAPLTNDFPVNTTTVQAQLAPSLAMSPAGNFVVVWSGPTAADPLVSGIVGQRFDAAGNKLGGEFQVNQYTPSYQNRPSVAMSSAGEFFVAWTSDQDDEIGAIMARRYNAAGSPLTGEFQVNTTESGAQYYPSVDVDSAGKAVVVWQSFFQDGSDAAIVGRRYDAAGNPLGGEFNVNTFTTGFQVRPTVGFGPDGDFTAAWTAFGIDGEPTKTGVVAQHFDATGKRDGGELLVNTYTPDIQQFVDVVADTRGQFIISWESKGADGAGYGIRSRLGGFPRALPMNVDTRASGGASNVNGVLESGEQVTVDPAYRNPSSAQALTMSSVASNIRGPAGGTYTLNDTTADYGDIAADASIDCFTATGDCFQATVGGTRPQQHWDAFYDENVTHDEVILGVDRTKIWSLHVGGSFPDVPLNAFYPFIENLFHNGVTGGCAGGGYCPGNNVTRAQMAVFLLKSRFGAGYVPAPATGTVFPDVPASNPFAPWIENLAGLAITGGCGGGLYCPDNPVTRQQMAVFLLKTKNGSTYAPPTGAGIFGDVACPSLTCDFIEDLYNQNITGGCQASPLLYCPGSNVLRQQMAVFLVKTFGLALYGN